MNNSTNRNDWLPVVVHKFKPSGKWYSEEEVLIPNTLDIYHRREYLDEKLGDSYFNYVS